MLQSSPPDFSYVPNVCRCSKQTNKGNDDNNNIRYMMDDPQQQRETQTLTCAAVNTSEETAKPQTD